MAALLENADPQMTPRALAKPYESPSTSRTSDDEAPIVDRLSEDESEARRSRAGTYDSHDMAHAARAASPAAAPDPSLSGAWLFDVRVMGVDCRKRESNGVRWYLVRLVCRQRPGLSWEVTHRFSEFDALARQIKPPESLALPPLPRKLPSMLLSHTEKVRRVVGLQRFCESLLASPALVGTAEVSTFFDLDFGLWHAAATEAAPRLDRSQQRAARMLQREIRRWSSVRSLQRARGAATSLQRAWRASPLAGSSKPATREPLLGFVNRTWEELFQPRAKP
mmetsp:Transcript_31042/g.102708  ORF Transcript_31042/g.102708 Transcript_31042/m.102708 type:complete len:280 (-) Transcript_31042:545-1384(-)